MKAKGIVWLGTRTSRFEEMVDFATDLFAIKPWRLTPNIKAVFDLPNGTRFEVFGTDDTTHAFLTCPLGGFLVDDAEAARKQLEARGIEFIGNIGRSSDGSVAWSYFRAPDGNIYEVTTGRPPRLEN